MTVGAAGIRSTPYPIRRTPGTRYRVRALQTMYTHRQRCSAADVPGLLALGQVQLWSIYGAQRTMGEDGWGSGIWVRMRKKEAERNEDRVGTNVCKEDRKCCGDAMTTPVAHLSCHPIFLSATVEIASGGWRAGSTTLIVSPIPLHLQSLYPSIFTEAPLTTSSSSEAIPTLHQRLVDAFHALYLSCLPASPVRRCPPRGRSIVEHHREPSTSPPYVQAPSSREGRHGLHWWITFPRLCFSASSLGFPFVFIFATFDVFVSRLRAGRTIAAPVSASPAQGLVRAMGEGLDDARRLGGGRQGGGEEEKECTSALRVRRAAEEDIV